jgi:hypothetical protein
MAKTSNNLCDNNVRFVLDQNALLDLYSASSLKQQSVGRDVTPLRDVTSLRDVTLLRDACWS